MSKLLPKPKKNSLKFIFGDPLESFASGLPTESEVVRRYMKLYDDARGVSFRMSPTRRQKIYEEIVDELLVNWSGQDVRPRSRIILMVKSVIEKADSLLKFTRKMDDLSWITLQQQIFSKTFDLKAFEPRTAAADTSMSDVSFKAFFYNLYSY